MELTMSLCAGATDCADPVVPSDLALPLSPSPRGLCAPLARGGSGSAPRCATRVFSWVGNSPKPSSGGSLEPPSCIFRSTCQTFVAS